MSRNFRSSWLTSASLNPLIDSLLMGVFPQSTTSTGIKSLLLRRGNDPAAFRWHDLCEEDLSQAELLMREHWAETTTHKLGSQLLVMTKFLAARNICRPLYYVLQTPRSEDLHQHTLAGSQARKAKLPSIRTLEGVADIYSMHAKDPPDRLRAAALALLVVT